MAGNHKYNIRVRSLKIGIVFLVITGSILTSTVWMQSRDGKSQDLKTYFGSNFTGVLLLTYMRSGSSVTGDILQQNKNVFYVYEPLRVLYQLIKHGKPIQWLNGSVSTEGTINITDVHMKALIGWMTCNFSLVYAQSFDDSNFLSYGNKTASYNECISRKYNVTIPGSSRNLSSIYVRKSAMNRGLNDKCLQELQNACLASKFRIIKSIRTSMHIAKELLADYKEYKVINLIRDPRATVSSQVHNDGCEEKNQTTQDCAKSHCEIVWKDSLIKEELLKIFPDRVLTILYENIATKPILMTESMYKFVGIEMSERLRTYVNRIVVEGNLTGCRVCQQAWQTGQNLTRDKMLFLKIMKRSDILRVNNVCQNVLKYYGYRFDIM